MTIGSTGSKYRLLCFYGVVRCLCNLQYLIMGIFTSKICWDDQLPEHIPPKNFKPQGDPNFGFKAPRKERVSRISEEEMKALRITPDRRDYCAHHIRDYKVCMRTYTPFYIFCKPEIEAHAHCLLEDHFMRMKEYEREKRLRIRQMKKEGKVIQ